MIKFLNRHKSKIFALLSCVLVVSCSFVLICSAESESADDIEKLSFEVGRTANCSFNFNGDAYTVNGLHASGNNITDLFNMVYYDGILADSEYISSTWEVEWDDTWSAFTLFADVYDASSVELHNSVSYTLSDFYIYALNSPDDGIDIFDNIYFYFEHFADSDIFESDATIYYQYCYYDLLDVNLYGEIEPVIEQNQFNLSDYATVENDRAYSQFRLYDFIGDVSESLFYFDYFTIIFDAGVADTEGEFYLRSEYSLVFNENVHFDYNDNFYRLTTQSDFDGFLMHQFSSSQPSSETIPSQYFRSYVDWLGTAVSGFLSFELFPGFYLGGVLVAVIAFSLVMWWLKMFGGG